MRAWRTVLPSSAFQATSSLLAHFSPPPALLSGGGEEGDLPIPCPTPYLCLLPPLPLLALQGHENMRGRLPPPPHTPTLPALPHPHLPTHHPHHHHRHHHCTPPPHPPPPPPPATMLPGRANAHQGQFGWGRQAWRPGAGSRVVPSGVWVCGQDGSWTAWYAYLTLTLNPYLGDALRWNVAACLLNSHSRLLQYVFHFATNLTFVSL